MVSFAAVLFAFLTHKMFTLSAFVEVKQGMIEGTVMETRQAEKFDAFLNIPYAQKPLGRLRFQAPLEALPWDGVKNGTAWGPMCTQVNLLSNSPTSEDCLSLNVFTKNLRSQQPLKPVIVYIHGGAFQLGSASDHQPHLLMERDVVLVSLNYRLGAFGFLSLGTKEVPGNQGMKDQVLALRWIKKNVEAFGGNPDMITLMGNSAGAYSVTAHMVSPMADGLFQRVIAFSGAITWQNKFEENYLDLAMKLAQKLNCTTSTIDDLTECLRSVPAEAFNFVELREFPQCTIMTWFPVVERDFGQERFLTESPVKLFEAQNYSKVPLLIGRTRDEFVDIPLRILDSDFRNKLAENFDKIAPHCFFYEADTDKSIAMSQRLSSVYFQHNQIDVRSVASFSQLFSDGYIGYPVHRLVHTISNISDVYYYQLSYVGRFSFFKHPHDKPYGVHHSDEMQYIMSTAFVGPQIEIEDEENRQVELMTRFVSRFTKTGNPNDDEDEFLREVHWPKHDATDEYFMDIGQHCIEKHGLGLDKYSVWEELEKSFSIVNIASLNILLLMSVSTILVA